MSADASGNCYVAGTEAGNIFVVKLDSSGQIVSSISFGGSGDDRATAMTADAAGNVYVTGVTSSTDFPVTKGAYRTTPPAGQAWTFVAKINADGTMGYVTYFSSSDSHPKAIAVDASGSAYITGQAYGGVPVTEGAYGPVCQCGSQSNGFFSIPYEDGFLARLDPAGSKLIFATYLGTPVSLSQTIGIALAVGSDGSAYVAGSMGVYRISASGSNLLGYGNPKVNIEAMALARDGSIYLAGGGLWRQGFRATPGAAQVAANMTPALPYQFYSDTQTAIVRIDEQLQGTVAATYLGFRTVPSVRSLATDRDGNLLVAGLTSPHGLPTEAPIAQGFGSPGTGFAAKLSADLSAILFSSYFGDAEDFAMQSVATGVNGRMLMAGATSTGAVWVNQVNAAAAPAMHIDSVVNAASKLDDPIAPGETIVVRGAGFTQDARLTIGGMTVDALSVTESEIVAIAPLSLSGAAVQVQVEAAGELSNSVLAPLAAASPGLFSADGSGVGQGYILNQDGTLNDPAHPARPGERITLFATGVGRMTFDNGYAVTDNPVEVYVEIFYARGVAAFLTPVKGFPGDVYQITVYVPTYEDLVAINPDLKSFQYPSQVGVVLKVAGRSSQDGLAISIAP